MMFNKTFAYLFVSLILTGAVTWSALTYIQNSHNEENNLSSPLLLSSIFEEALQELCPFPGYSGDFCPGPMAPRSQSFRSGPHLMPMGIGASFDLTTGDLKLPSIQLTYSSNEIMWTDPATGRQFQVADEINVQDAGSYAETRVFRDINELSNVWRDAQERGEWLGGQFSQSKDLNQLFDEYFNGEQQTSVSQLAKGALRLTFKSGDLRLNRFAQRAIDSLPEGYDEYTYNEFINSWGTHITVDTMIGGMIEKQTVFKECVNASPSYTGGLNADQINQALNNELYGGQGDAYFAARRRVSIDRKLGGNPEDVPNWEQTISQNPALLKINRFVSWSDLVANPQVRANLQMAIQNRVQAMKNNLSASQAYVAERKRQQKIAARPGYLVQKNSKNEFVIQQQFTMLSAPQCPYSDPWKYRRECQVVQITPPPQQQIPVWIILGYERDDQGNFRVTFDQQHQQLRGNWVENGCSIAQNPRAVQYTDINQPAPPKSAPVLICTGCYPQSVNGGALGCYCPTF